MQQHGFQMAALASTRLDMWQTPQQTAEVNPSHYTVEKSCGIFVHPFNCTFTLTLVSISTNAMFVTDFGEKLHQFIGTVAILKWSKWSKFRGLTAVAVVYILSRKLSFCKSDQNLLATCEILRNFDNERPILRTRPFGVGLAP